MAMTRRYYSARTGKNPQANHIDLPMLLRLFKDIYRDYTERGYFQQAFGYSCVDAGDVPGSLGADVAAQVFRRIRKADLWPIEQCCLEYKEDDLFDVIEFLYDSVAKPLDGYHHDFNGCGWHYSSFDRESGQEEYRLEITSLLQDYGEGFELSAKGEILGSPEHGLESLLEASVPPLDPDNVNDRVERAILKFRRYKSSLDDRRDAVRDLADVLEFLRPKLKTVLARKDESDLFNLANNFGIRHHEEGQQTDYDKAIWQSWMFYYYLATIHASVRLLEQHKSNSLTTDD